MTVATHRVDIATPPVCPSVHHMLVLYRRKSPIDRFYLSQNIRDTKLGQVYPITEVVHTHVLKSFNYLYNFISQ